MRLALVAVLAALLLPVASAAQQVKGRVVDADEGTPVAGATITLSDTAGTALRQVVAGDDGLFWLGHSEAGPFLLSVQRIGYAAVRAQPVRLDSAEVVEVLIRMQPEAVPVEPIRVLARREIEQFTPDEFYDRMSRLEDRGYFMTREEVEATGARLPSLAMQWIPGTWIQPTARFGFNNSIALMSYGRVCKPAMYLNGRPLPDWAHFDDFVMVDRIEGIEVYRGNFVPDTYHHTDDSWGCGFILVWTKTEYDPRFAFSWERTIIFGVLGGLVLGLPLLF